MDTLIKTLERQAMNGDLNARRQLVSLQLRQGVEYPVGSIVVMDHLKGCETPAQKILAPFYKYSGVFVVTKTRKGRNALHGEGLVVTMRRLKKDGTLASPRFRHNTYVEHESSFRSMTVSVSAPTMDVGDLSGVERAPEGAKTVREFSSFGPCLTLGKLVRETAKQYVMEVKNGRNAKNMVRKKARRLHLDPCKSCQDHRKTAYPDGYLG